jgi:hypothetical protein
MKCEVSERRSGPPCLDEASAFAAPPLSLGTKTSRRNGARCFVLSRPNPEVSPWPSEPRLVLLGNASSRLVVRRSDSCIVADGAGLLLRCPGGAKEKPRTPHLMPTTHLVVREWSSLDRRHFSAARAQKQQRRRDCCRSI